MYSISWLSPLLITSPFILKPRITHFVSPFAQGTKRAITFIPNINIKNITIFFTVISSHISIIKLFYNIKLKKLIKILEILN